MKPLPIITEDDARRRAYAAFMKSMSLHTPAAREKVFRSHGLMVRGKGELLYRSSEHDGKLIPLVARTTSR